MLDVQMQLVSLDAERGIKSIPKLVETEKKELVEVWARCGGARRTGRGRRAPLRARREAIRPRLSCRERAAC